MGIVHNNWMDFHLFFVKIQLCAYWGYKEIGKGPVS